MNFATQLGKLSNDELVETLGYKVPGSINHELVKGEIQRRTIRFGNKDERIEKSALVAAWVSVALAIAGLGWFS